MSRDGAGGTVAGVLRQYGCHQSRVSLVIPGTAVSTRSGQGVAKSVVGDGLVL